MDSFDKRKQNVLNKKDKSSIGKWDEKILKLCEKINKSKNYYTTSSCAGRILFIIDQEKKGEDLFLKVWHEKVKFEELEKAINEIIKNKNFNVKFKQESFIIHIACRTLKDAKKLLDSARKAGIKKAGIISLNEKSIIIEIVGSEKIEFPVISNGKLLVNDNFLKLVLKKANENLEKGWERIKRLEKLVR